MRQFVFLLLIVVSTSTAWAQSSALDEALGRGISAYFQGQRSAAEQILSTAIDAGSRDPQAYYFRGLARWQAGREADARADFTAGAKLEAELGSRFAQSAKSLERVQGRARLVLQQIRQVERSATAQQRETDKVAKFDLKSELDKPKPEAVAVPSPMPPANATAATSTPTVPMPTMPMPTAPMPTPTTPAPTTPVTVAAPAALPESPDLLYAELVKQASNGHPEVIWQALPAKYQADLKSVINEFGAKMDKELWDKSFAVLGKLTKTVKDKRDFILGHPLVALALPQLKVNGNPVTIDEIKQGWDPTAEFLQAVVTSEISTVENLAKLDPPAYLGGSIAKAVAKMNDAIAQAKGKSRDELVQEHLAKHKVTIVKTEGDTMEVQFEAEGQEPKTTMFKKVDNRWLPAEMVDQWDAQIAQAKAAIAAMDFSGSQKAQAMGVFTLVEPVLDQMLAAQDQDAFNAVIAGVLPLIQGMMGGAPPGM